MTETLWFNFRVITVNCFTVIIKNKKVGFLHPKYTLVLIVVVPANWAYLLLSETHHEKTFFLHMSRVVRKLDFCICKNKGADQLRGNREADQRLCFCYSDSVIPLLPKSEISSL